MICYRFHQFFDRERETMIYLFSNPESTPPPQARVTTRRYCSVVTGGNNRLIRRGQLQKAAGEYE